MPTLRQMVLCLAAWIVASGCESRTQQVGDGPKKSEIAGAGRSSPEKCDVPGLSNVLHIDEKIYSGSEPHDDASFEGLARLGITTIVSVDGARPDIQAAKAHGLQYVHIPIGYDGVPSEAAALLTRVVRERPGTIYIHCHHGQHRGPAAAAIASIARGSHTSQTALDILTLAGTDKNYEGLWRDVAAFEPLPAGASLPELHEVADVGSLAAAMAALDRHFDHLKLLQESRWQTPAAHADLAAEQEALIVREGFREASRHSNESQHADLAALMGQAEQQAHALETALRGKQFDAADANFRALGQSCKECHKTHRNPASPRPAAK